MRTLNKLLLLLVLLLGVPVVYADNYFHFDGSNDRMAGNLTTGYAATVTMCAWFRFSSHPSANDMIFQLGSAAASSTDSQAIRVAATVNTFTALIDVTAGTSVATVTKTSINNVWTPMCATFTSATRRDVWVADQTNNNTTSRTIASNQDEAVVGETLDGTADFTGDIAYVSLWDVASSSDVTSFLAGTCPSTIDSAHLVGYWDMQTTGSPQLNAGTNATGDLTVTGATFTSTGGPGISCAVAATFTAGPTQVAVTPVTLQVSFTSDTDGTVKGVVCANGNLGNATEILAGQCSGGGAAVATISQAVTATVADGDTFSGLTPGTTYDTGYVIDATVDSTLATLADQTTSAVAYTSNPSCSATTNGVSCTYTANATGTNYGVGVNPGDGTPSCTQIKAGQNDGGSAALWTGSDANTLNVSDTVTVTGTNKPVRMNMHFCQNASGVDSAVYSGQTNKDRSPKSGFALVVLASIDAAGICDLDSVFNPDCAIGDVFEYEDDTNESADCNTSISTSGLLTLTPVAPGDCDNRRTFEISYQDVSNATTGLFTAPTNGNFTTDDTAYINNEIPVCAVPSGSEVILLVKDGAMTTIDLKVLAQCADAEDDLLTFSVTVGTLPTGTSLGGTGNKDWTGTPTVEDEGGENLTVQVCDIASDCDTFDLVVYVTDDAIPAPDCVGDIAAACITALDAVRPWLDTGDQLLATFAFSASVPLNDIISQNPAAAGSMTTSDPLDVVVSLGVQPLGSKSIQPMQIHPPRGMRVEQQ